MCQAILKQFEVERNFDVNNELKNSRLWVLQSLALYYTSKTRLSELKFKDLAKCVRWESNPNSIWPIKLNSAFRRFQAIWSAFKRV